jgi:hypothetical protein
MDAGDIGRITAALTSAINDARVHGGNFGVDLHFRQTVQYAREVHDLLHEVMREAPEFVTESLRIYCDQTDAEIRLLEQFPRAPDR